MGEFIEVRSNQRLNGNVSADATLNVADYSGAVTAIATAATGNTGESNVEDTGLVGVGVQTAGAVTVQAFSRYNGPEAETGSLSVSSQAIVNSQGYGVTNSVSNVTLSQDSDAIAQSDVGVTLRYTDGIAVNSALSTANNVTATGIGDSDQTLDITQRSTGERIEATSFNFAGNAQDITGQSTATANNLSATNEGGFLDLASSQTNSSNVGAETYVSSFQFGAGQANAFGVANSVMAGNYGPVVNVDNTQVNTGGVSVMSTFVGDNGYDAYVSASAMGNAVTGFACSECDPRRLTANNRQTNDGPISAQGTATINGPARQVSSVVSATGNTATFYVSPPH